MAVSPFVLFPTKTTAPSANYPLGGAQNITITGDGTGTPWITSMINDVFGFQQRMISEANITISGNSETAIASDYFDALEDCFERRLVYSDSGVANSYALSTVSGAGLGNGLINGAMFRFQAANANDSLSGINVESIGLKSLRASDGSQLIGGEIRADNQTVVQYVASSDRFVLISEPLKADPAGNLMWGRNAGLNISAGTNNILLGTDAGRDLSTGSEGTFVGAGTGRMNATQLQNTYIGAFAGADNEGANNTFVGRYAGAGFSSGGLHANSCVFGRNTAISGPGGSNNTIMGHGAVTASGFASDDNTVVGAGGGVALTTGSRNLFAGVEAGSLIYSGNGNVMLGVDSGTSSAQQRPVAGVMGNLGGSNSKIFMVSSGDTASDVLISGSFVDGSFALNNGDLLIPNISTIGSGTDLVYDEATDTIKKISSSERYKTNISYEGIDSDFILAFKPASCNYRKTAREKISEGEGVRQVISQTEYEPEKRLTLIAEDCEKTNKNVVGYEKDGITAATVRYGQPDMVTGLIHKIQQLWDKVEALENNAVSLK